MEPAVSLNLIAPLSSFLMNATASISITEPRKPDTPSPNILPTSGVLDALMCTYGAVLPP